MHGGAVGPTAAAGAARARFPAVSASVPAARALVRHALGPADPPDPRPVPPAVVADAELCVSELVTNAVVHARTELEVLVSVDAAVVRLEVHDLSPRAPRQRLRGPGATTGRGLEMVRLLSRDWGVDPRPGQGKAVWCELVLDGAAPAEDVDLDALLEAWSDEPVARPDPGAGWVRLQRYPVRRGMRAQEHKEALLRECLLLADAASRGSTQAPQRLLQTAAEISARYGEELAEPQRRREQAYLRGEAEVELLYPLVPGAAEVVAGWREVLAALDAYAQDSALLTLSTPQDVRELDDWLFDEVLAQVGGAAPTPWPGPLD
jgi:hypothetical protein